MSSFEKDGLQRVARERALTDEVVASFAAADNDRYRIVMQSLVRHLHDFLREVRLTQHEWDDAVEFLTRAGHITDDKRQEFILLSDVLGVSMMTVGMNSPVSCSATESTVFGPFFVADAPDYPTGADISQGMSGRPCLVHGRVTDLDGRPVCDASIEVWAADDDGYYDVQYDDDTLRGRGRLRTDEHGSYAFWTIQPAAYPIPHDGPVGDLLDAAGRSPMRPAHVHFMVTHPSYDSLITHVFVSGDEWLESDAVFGVKNSLIAEFVEHTDSPAPYRRELDQPWSECTFNIRLAPK